MIYDCFSFFNELDLLEIRMNVLKDIVDRFVLVEARQTHTGKPKPLYYEANKTRYAKFHDRIIHVVIDEFPKEYDAWRNENCQRNAIMRGLTAAKPDDKILISDLDEIPNPEIVRKLAGKRGVWRFNHVSYGFYLNMMNLRCWNMCGTQMLSFRDLSTGFDGCNASYTEFVPKDINEGTTVTKIRRCRFPREKGGEKLVKKAGWHFTCLGGAEAILMKMRAVAPHHDFNPDDPALTVEAIRGLLAKGMGPALKMNCFAVPLDDTFPKYIIENRDKYKHLIFPVTKEYMKSVRWMRLFRMVQGRMIQFFEWVIPSRLHYALHVVRMAMLNVNKKGK